MVKNPLVSIIILNWNGKHLIEECLSSVFNLDYAPVEIIVLDNNSIDGPEDYLGGREGIILIRNTTNIGYAGGNNVGLKAAKGKYCALLNNDMIVDKAWLNDPVQILEENNGIGIISCRQMNYWNREIIDGLYHFMAKTLKTGVAGEGERYSDKPEYSSSGYILSANGGSMVIRKEIIEQLGGFDERLFAYGEDVDLSLRAFLHSWDCFYASQAIVYHKRSASFNKYPEKKMYYEWRNRYFVLYKFFPWRLIMRHLYWIIWNEGRTIGYIFIRMKKPWLYFSIWLSIFKGFGRFSKDRKENARYFTIRESDFSNFMRYPIRHV